jgi:hypothetical protein
MISDDQFARMLRKGEVTPEEGLAMLQRNEVQVYPDPEADIDKANASWGEVEDIGAGASAIQHSLYQAGGRALAEQYQAEIERLRSEGHVLTL